MTTTPPLSGQAEQQPHLPPSLPSSPLPKRLKKMAPSSVGATADEQLPLLVKKLSASAKAPTRGSAFAAGYDIYSAQATTVPGRGKALVDTGIAIAVPQGTCKSSSVTARRVPWIPQECSGSCLQNEFFSARCL